MTPDSRPNAEHPPWFTGLAWKGIPLIVSMTSPKG